LIGCGYSANILESLDDGLLVVDLLDRVVRWNHALEQFCNVSREGGVGRLDELFPTRS
jgi:PAS domain-containing protein